MRVFIEVPTEEGWKLLESFEVWSGDTITIVDNIPRQLTKKAWWVVRFLRKLMTWPFTDTLPS